MVFIHWFYDAWISNNKHLEMLEGKSRKRYCQKCEDLDYIWTEGLCFHCALDISDQGLDI